MATSFLIIDGYNLLHAAGLARANYAPGDLQRLRHRLLVLISGCLSTEERQRCTVVFDAIEAPSGLDREYQHEGIAVQFAEPGHEADEVIEHLIARHSAARQLVVVSSDHRLQRAARSRRAACLDSEAFLSRMARRKANTDDSIGEHNTDSSRLRPSAAVNRDVTFWMREFGEIDIEAIAQEDNKPTTADPWTQQMRELQQQLDSAEDLERWLNEPPPQERRK